MPTKVAVTDPDGGIPLETIRRVMERVDRQMVDVTPQPAPLPLDHKRQREVASFDSPQVVSVNWWKSSWHQPSTSEQLTESLFTPPPFVE